jgi:hypothetical protein
MEKTPRNSIQKSKKMNKKRTQKSTLFRIILQPNSMFKKKASSLPVVDPDNCGWRGHG